MNEISDHSAANRKIRLARPSDAGVISEVYRAIWGTKKAEAGDEYPFSQFLDADWVEDAIKQEHVWWLVAGTGKSVTGVIGMVPNIGSQEDRIADCFGLVVGPGSQGRGVGKNLIAEQTKFLNGRAAVLTGETRTADPVGYRVISSAGWLPLGFEPFAHKLPTGTEPVILMGYVSEEAKRQRQLPVHMTPAVVPLAEAVLSSLELSVPASIKVPGYPVEDTAWGKIRQSLSAAEEDLPVALGRSLNDDDVFQFRSGEDRDIGFESESDDLIARNVGVITLRHMQPHDSTGRRMMETRLHGFIGMTPVASAHLDWDFRDTRVRIHSLVARLPGLQGTMLSALISWIDEERQAREIPLSVIVDVRADQPTLQATLERLGFFPTGYYPAFIAENEMRHDVVHYTKLYDWDFAKCIEEVYRPELAEASDVITAVADGAQLGAR